MKFAACVLITAGLMIAGCGTEEVPPRNQADLDRQHADGLSTPIATTTSTAPTSADPAKSPRDNLIKQVGQAGGVSNADGKTMFTFTVDKIVVDPKCTSPYAEKAERGHYVALHLTVKTTPEFTVADSVSMITQHDFDIVGPDGISESEVASLQMCMENDEYLTSDQFSPASQYGGLIVLDTKSTTGVAILRPVGMEGGWEWSF